MPEARFVVQRELSVKGGHWAYIDSCPHGSDLGAIHFGPTFRNDRKPEDKTWTDITWEWKDLGNGRCRISPSILAKNVHNGQDCHFAPGEFPFIWLEPGEYRNTEPFHTRYLDWCKRIGQTPRPMLSPEEPTKLLHFPITAYITDTHAEMSHWVECPVCHGCITFNLGELRERKSKGQSTSVYCAGWPDLTESGGDPHNHYHPGFPPEPIYRIPWKGDGTLPVAPSPVRFHPHVTLYVDLDGTVAPAGAPAGGMPGISAPPLPGSVESLNRLSSEGFRIVYWTGRWEKWRLNTLRWLVKNGFPGDGLLMVPDGTPPGNWPAYLQAKGSLLPALGRDELGIVVDNDLPYRQEAERRGYKTVDSNLGWVKIEEEIRKLLPQNEQ